MDPEILLTVEEEVAAVRRNTVADDSRDIYRRSSVDFVLWLHANESPLVNLDFGKDANGNVNNTSLSIALNSPNLQILPINFNELTAKEFMKFIVTRRKRDGGRPGFSTFNTHRSSLKNLFRDYEQQMSTTLAIELKHHFKGLKRQLAVEMGLGRRSITTGKYPLSFSLYKFLGECLLKSRKANTVFAHTFMILCWNLMCRAGNCVSICFNHMEWRDDALGIYFAHMKNDQTGERPKDPRHIYANPINPMICPILSLGLYLLCLPDIAGVNQLFPGGGQYERFRQIFLQILSENALQEVHARGRVPSDFGTHSFRKGATTYTSSGSTACPSSTAVHLRAGWKFRGIQDTYFR